MKVGSRVSFFIVEIVGYTHAALAADRDHGTIFEKELRFGSGTGNDFVRFIKRISHFSRTVFTDMDNLDLPSQRCNGPDSIDSCMHTHK